MMHSKRYPIVLFLLSCATNYPYHCSLSRALTEQSPFEVAMNTPTSFGKTHFIVGHPLSASLSGPAVINSKSDAVVLPSLPSPASLRVFFAPDDDVRSELVQLIDQELQAIAIAIFMVTDP